MSLLETIEESIKNLLVTHLEGVDNSLFDFPSLIEKLANWAIGDIHSREANERKIRENPYPLIIFLLVLESSPLIQIKNSNNSISLESLIHSKKLARLTAIVFNAALERPRINSIHTRKPAESILRTWISEYSLLGNHTDQKECLLTLAKMLVITASSPNDIDRILYIFNPIFTEKMLRTA